MPPGNEQRHPCKAAISIFIAIMTMVLLNPTRVLAHKVNVFAWVEGDTVFVEGYYSGNKRAQYSLIEVFNEAGAKLLEGKTDEKGEFSFKTPEKTELRIVLTAGTGHKNDFVVHPSDFDQEASSPPGSPSDLQAHEAQNTKAVADSRQLERIIDEALDRKLAPVIKLIRDTRKEGPTMSEIVAGIGYIFGLFGVAIYFSNRKKGLGRKVHGTRQDENH
jgi:nickel transport protein